jgi:signal transduction histidine kinase
MRKILVFSTLSILEAVQKKNTKRFNSSIKFTNLRVAGLGLSLSYDIVVKGHGGSIQVISVEGSGAEFIIQLPIK